MRTKLIATGALTVVAALVPAGAQASGLDTAVSHVRAHTHRADAALDRAVSLFNQHANQRGSRAFGQSRRELRAANADAAKLRRRAHTRSQRAAAAQAEALVAKQEDRDVEKLVGVLDEARGEVESSIAQAALSDTRGRTKAIAIITALLERGVPAQAANGLSHALAALSTNRDDEVTAEVDALVSDQVSNTDKGTVAKATAQTIDGQTQAAGKLAELIASDQMPAASKPGLQRAYDAIVKEHGSAVDILSHLSDRMPDFVRSFVQQVITQARGDAPGLGQNRPTPPVPPHPGPGGPFAG